MFTGIVEDVGLIKNIESQGSNLIFEIESRLTPFIKVDQSIAHNGICLTITSINNDLYTVVAIKETILKTNISQWRVHDSLNLERAMILGERLDGHIVQGHIDDTIEIIDKQFIDGSCNFKFLFDKKHKFLLVEKGSVCLDGISLTCFNVSESSFMVSIIPYTMENTIINQWQVRQKVNIEFDFLGKMIAKQMELRGY